MSAETDNISKISYKFRLYPTRKQAASLQWTLDRCRELYNAALQERREVYKYTGKGTNYNAQADQLPEIKEIRPEYHDIYSQVLQDVLRRVDKAFKDFFRRVKNGEKPGYPRYQGKSRYDSFTYPQIGFSLTHDNRLCLVKIGSIKVKLHREIKGKIKTCTIKREEEHWYVCFSCEVESRDQQQTPYTDEAIGIDLGIYHFAALSTGDTIESPKYYRQAEQKIARLQRKAARKKKSSKRRKKAVQQVAKAYRKVRNQRKNFLHQQSRQLVNTYETIVFEDLAPSDMSKCPEPKQDETTGHYLPNGASQKAGLNKSILDAGWSTFVAMCMYKAACAGTVQVVKVDPYKTSQVCSHCGKEGPHKDLNERVFTCEHCGFVLDRDINAAINILKVWHGLDLHVASKRKRQRKRKNKLQARTEPSEAASKKAPLRSPRRIA
jgi:putative transposase